METIHEKGKWKIQVAENGDYRIVNEGSDGRLDYYSVQNGNYGQPLIVAEPTRALPVPAGLKFVNKTGKDVNPDQKVAGIICREGPRFSLTNAEKQGVKIEVADDGFLSIDGETWWITTLFMKDKNRLFGYDAYCVRERPDHVRVLELADLDLF